VKVKDLKKLVILDYNPEALAGFRRKALATPKEILGFLVGEYWKDGDGYWHARVDDIYYPELEVSTENEVRAMDERVEGSIGSIHSHPNTQWYGLSMDDVHSSIWDDEKIYCIYTYFQPDEGRRRTQQAWYAPGKVVVLNK
jgi:proteasome lid subunit RPN8/RPN11